MRAWVVTLGAAAALACGEGGEPRGEPASGGSGGSASPTSGAAGIAAGGSGAVDVCRLPRAEGTCTTFSVAYYFDDVSDWCQPFNYRGCEGNDNRFPTKEACEVACITGKAECAGGTDVPEEECAGAFGRGLCFASEQAACACDGCDLAACEILTVGVSPAPMATCPR
jgi:hypothetical protein